MREAHAVADIKVTGPGSIRGPSASERRKKSGGDRGAFADQLREASETGEAAAAYEATPAATVDAVLAVQQVDDASAERGRGQMRRRGDALLDRLEALRAQILAGHLSKDDLARLAQMVREQRPRTNDPRLSDILDEIELRVEVEIAKYTRFG